MRRPIRSQFMTPLVAVAVVSLLAVAALNGWATSATTRTRVEARVRSVARALSEADFPLTDRVLRQMGDLAGAEFVLCDAAGTQRASSGGPASGHRFGPGEPVATVRGPDRVSLGPTLRIGAQAYYHSALRLDRPGSPDRSAVLQVLVSQTEYNAAWLAAFAPPLGVAIVSAAAVAAVTAVVSRRISSYLAALRDEVARIAGGDFSPVPTPRRDDELLDLARSVNTMAGRLAAYEEEVRRTERLRTLAMLGAGLAHEVRNAATGCRLAIDLHEADCTRDTQGDASLSVARRQLALIESRLQQLLRVGRDPDAPRVERLDLAKAVATAIGLVEVAAEHAGVKLTWAPPSAGSVVMGDAEGLTQALVNLLLNAIEAASKRTAEGGAPPEVRVTLESDGASGVEMTVGDNGDGPDPRVVNSLFDPFVTGKPEGIGVGLAVVRQVVEASGGRSTWQRRAGWTEFTLSMPRAALECVNG